MSTEKTEAPTKRRSAMLLSLALGATLATMLMAAVAFGGDLTLCQQAYLASGLTEQQMSLEEFGALYGDAFCALEEVQSKE